MKYKSQSKKRIIDLSNLVKGRRNGYIDGMNCKHMNNFWQLVQETFVFCIWDKRQAGAIF